MKSKKLLIASIFILLIAVFGLFLPTSATYYSQKPALGVGINWAHPLAKGLVGCWVMNEGSGDKIFDLSGNNITATKNAGVSWKAGNMFFDETATPVIDFGTQINMAAWAELSVVARIEYQETAQTAEYTILSNYDSGLACGTLRVEPATDSLEALVVVQANTLVSLNATDLVLANGVNDVAFTFDTAYLRCFLNGKESSSSTVTGATLDIGDSIALLMGNMPTRSDYFNGFIHYLCLYNRTLASSEIASFDREPYAMFKPTINIAQLYGAVAAPPVGLSIPVAQQHYFQRRRR